MPLGPGIRYRVTRRGGKNIRLAFRGNTVVETKDLGKPKVKRKKS